MLLGTLVTIANPREAIRNAPLAASMGIPVIVDSGAWSNYTGAANVTLSDHIQFLRQNWVHGARHISLDVIGNPPESLKNWLAERDAGLEVEPTIHYGTRPDFVHNYLRRGLGTNWINLGGMAHLQGQKTLHRHLAAWSAAVMRECPPGTKFHALGGITPGLNHLVKYDAVDSTYWLQVYKWNTVPVFNPVGPEWAIANRSLRGADWKRGKSQRLGRMGPLLERCFGITASEFVTLADEDLAVLAMKSHQQFGDHFEKRHGQTMTVYLAGSTHKNYSTISHLNREKL